jgi:hypothetical protein
MVAPPAAARRRWPTTAGAPTISGTTSVGAPSAANDSAAAYSSCLRASITGQTRSAESAAACASVRRDDTPSSGTPVASASSAGRPADAVGGPRE